jgi:hypothetical protein
MMLLSAGFYGNGIYPHHFKALKSRGSRIEKGIFVHFGGSFFSFCAPFSHGYESYGNFRHFFL